jgi:hypothetical protein
MVEKQQKPLTVRHVDRPEVTETFVDSLHRIQWDGQALRVELCVTRFPEPDAPAGAEANRYTACRLVLTPQAMLDLSNGLRQTMAALEQAGLVGQQSASAATPAKPS